MSKRLDMIEAMIAKGSREPFHWYARAMELRSIGRLEDALAAYRECAGHFPDYVPTYLMAGQVAAEAGHIDLARSFMTTGLEKARAAGDDHALSELETALAAL